MTKRPAVGVVGLGAMGLGIAQVFAQAGFVVLATDARAESRDAAASAMERALTTRVSAGKMTQADRQAAVSRLVVVTGPEAMGAASLVIEAIVEDAEAKRAVFRALEKATDGDAVLASNTSSLSIASLAEGLTRPERLVGLHFFNPAPAMRLVELVAHSGCVPDALALARDAAETAGKTVIACPDRPGFIVNRCARPFYGEALAMVQEGRNPREIDAAILVAGYRIGPLSLIDLIGADVHLAATQGIFFAMDRHPRYHAFQPLIDQVARGDLGRKTARGFVVPGEPGTVPADASEIRQRIEATLVNEAAWLLSEGGVSADGIDMAMKLGMNFPRGPFEILHAEGAGNVLRRLERLEDASPAALRGRYLPAPALMELA